MPKLGSRLYKLSSEKREYRNTAARKYILEALEEEKGLALSEVTVNELENGLTVMVELKYNGENSILSIYLG